MHELFFTKAQLRIGTSKEIYIIHKIGMQISHLNKNCELTNRDNGIKGLIVVSE